MVILLESQPLNFVYGEHIDRSAVADVQDLAADFLIHGAPPSRCGNRPLPG